MQFSNSEEVADFKLQLCKTKLDLPFNFAIAGRSNFLSSACCPNKNNNNKLYLDSTFQTPNAAHHAVSSNM